MDSKKVTNLTYLFLELKLGYVIRDGIKAESQWINIW